MEKCFDLGALLRNNQMKHKGKPGQFVSFAQGVQKRLKTNLKNRRSSRLTLFDRSRNFTACEIPITKSEAQLKLEHRRQQLEKWKEERATKKREQIALKKKPFVVGIAYAPIKFELPPPVPKPCTSGRVTRSQAAKISSKDKKQSQAKQVSFAPENASFQPPQIRNTNNTNKPPTLAPVVRPTKSNTKKTNALTFNPVLPNTTVKQTRSKTLHNNRQIVTDVKKPIKPIETRSVKSKVVSEPPQKTNRFTKPLILQSSSSVSDSERSSVTQSSSSASDIEPSKSSICAQTSIKHNGKSGRCKRIVNRNSCGILKINVNYIATPEEEPITTKKINRIQTPGPSRSLMRKTKQLPDKTLAFSTSSEETSSDVESLTRSAKRKSARISIRHVRNSANSDTLGNNSKSRNSSIIIASGSVEIAEDIAGEVGNAVDKMTPKKSLPNTPNSLSVPKSESNFEQKLRSPPLTPEQMEHAMRSSPSVTLSRGYDNAMKEMNWKLKEGLMDCDPGDVENVEPFRVQLDSEIKRMTELCDTWEKISEQTLMPEAAQEEVLSAVGQARLLMSQKLQQYRGLVEQCARPEPLTELVTLSDVQGFWDLVYMQIKNIDMKFNNLTELRARGWCAAQTADAELKKKPSKPAAGKRAATGTAGTSKPPGPSRLKEMIAAARLAKKTQTGQLAVATPEKTFEAGFFSVRSPVRTPGSAPRSPRPATATPLAGSLRKAVVSSEARKKASFAILHASFISKFDGVAPLELTPMTRMNFDATPGRSILKSGKSNLQSAKKSVKVVLFVDQDSPISSVVSDEDGTLTRDDKVQSSVDGVEKFQEDLVATVGAQRHPLIRQDAVTTPSPRQRHADVTTKVLTRSQYKILTEADVETEKNKQDTVTDLTKAGKSTPGKDVNGGTVTKKRQTPRKKITAQDGDNEAVERKVPSTRKKNATGNAEEKTPLTRKKAAQKSVLQEMPVNVIDDNMTPRKASGRRNSTAKRM